MAAECALRPRSAPGSEGAGSLVAGPGGRGAGGAGGRRRWGGISCTDYKQQQRESGASGGAAAPDAAGPRGFPLVRPGLLGTAGQSGGVPAGNWRRSARPPRGRPSPPPRRLPGTCSRAPASGGGGARTAAPAGGGLQRASASPSRRAGRGRVSRRRAPPGRASRAAAGGQSHPDFRQPLPRDPSRAGAGLFRAAAPPDRLGESGAHHRAADLAGWGFLWPAPTHGDREGAPVEERWARLLISGKTLPPRRGEEMAGRISDLRPRSVHLGCPRLYQSCFEYSVTLTKF